MPDSNLQKFIEKAVAVHGDRYDYSRVEYVLGTSSVEIICEEHGPFMQLRGNHIKGAGCTRCTPQKTSKEDFIRRAREKHGNFFDYSFVSFKKTRDKVEIICPTHGSFLQQARDHMRGIGCRNCSNDSKRVGFSDFVERSRTKHGNKYVYQESNWTGDSRTVIECPVHGEFLQFWYNHTIGDGCQKCGRVTDEDFLRRFKETHSDTYDYSKVIFDGCHTKVTVVCSVHGDFQVRPYHHYAGTGCNKCSPTGTSHGEQMLARFIESLGLEIAQSDYSVLGSHEIDIFIPSLNLGFEFNGSYWHSDEVIFPKKGITALEYHTQKLTGAASAGVSLYFVWESDWIASRSLIESAVTSIITAAQSNQSPDPFSVKLLGKLESPIELEELTEIEETLLEAA